MFNTFRKETDKVSSKYNDGCYTVTCAALLIDCVLLSPVVKETKGSGEGPEQKANQSLLKTTEDLEVGQYIAMGIYAVRI